MAISCGKTRSRYASQLSRIPLLQVIDIREKYGDWSAYGFHIHTLTRDLNAIQLYKETNMHARFPSEYSSVFTGSTVQQAAENHTKQRVHKSLRFSVPVFLYRTQPPSHDGCLTLHLSVVNGVCVCDIQNHHYWLPCGSTTHYVLSWQSMDYHREIHTIKVLHQGWIDIGHCHGQFWDHG